MAVANGTTKVNGLSNGVNGKMNGKIVHRRRASKKSPGFFSWTISTAARLSSWFIIYTILFRCPNTAEQCNETSPFVCQHYFQAKTFLAPHLQPYYEQYAGPYVEVAQPYYDILNKRVLTPTRDYTVQYGAPWVERGQQLAQSKWEQTAQPRLTELQVLAQDQYEKNLAPYLAHASDTVGPYYDLAQSKSLQIYYDHILPGYALAQPYALEGYQVASDFTTSTALPAIYWTYNKTYAFVDTALWPHVRVLYVENVEPQLVRIRERLGRYRNKAGAFKSDGSIPSNFSESLKSSLDQASVVSIEPSSTTSIAREDTAATGHQITEPILDYDNTVKAPPPAYDETVKRRTTREMVAEDLALWQNKFAARADEGAADMEERLSEIAQRMISEHVETEGANLVSTLERNINDGFAELKNKLIAVVKDGGDTVAASEEAAIQAIRSTGVDIKEKFQALREWHVTYDNELKNTVVEAAETHFLILDETRSLALQQIGQKWAWADGVTYKDWAKYHELKSTLTQWTEQLKERIVSHPTLLEAQEAARLVEDEGMELAANAAKELARLKEVSRYKIIASDTSDNFDLQEMKAAAEEALLAAQRAKEAEEAALREAEEAALRAREAEEAALREAEEAALREARETEALAAQEAEEALLAEASLSPDPTSIDNIAESASSIASAETVDSLADNNSNSPSIHDESATSETTVAAVEAEPSLADNADEVHVSTTAHESSATTAAELAQAEDPTAAAVDSASAASDDAETAQDELSASATPSVKPALFGAAAQDVPDRKPILDDYDDTDVVNDVTEAASRAFSTAVSRASDQYSSAMSVISAQIYGTPQPVHEHLFGSVGDAYEKAVAAAGDKLKIAKEAAVAGLYGTPTPTPSPTRVDWSKVESIAAQRLNEGKLWAELQYSSAIIALGLATATPTSVTEKYAQQAKLNYYAGLGLAQDRYASFMSAASAAFSRVTATPTPTNYAESASSIASVARASAASAASAAGEAAESAYLAATGSIASIIDDVEGTVNAAFEGAAEQLYLAGASVADTWDAVIGELNNRIYGGTNPLIGWYDNLASDARSVASIAADATEEKASSAADAAASASSEAKKRYDAVAELVSELIIGKEPSFTASVLSRLGAAYATASASVEQFASGVGSAASHATEVVKETLGVTRDEL